MEMLQSFKKCLVTTVPLMVVKYNKQASIDETLEKRLAADLYISARLEQDSFVTYRKFSISSLEKAGFSHEDAQMMSVDKNKIPHDRRELVMKYEREKIIEEYVEGNNYYRTLSGLPDSEDTDEIFLPDEFYEKYDIDPTTPLHKITRDLLSLLEMEGVLSELYKEHKKEYIKHLGERSVDIVTARLADNFSLLYFPKNNVDTFYKDFLLTYDECREYFINVIYNRHMSDMYERYDEFIAFSLLTMTIQRLITGIFKVMVDRDFYDVDTIRLFLESYNVPFIRALPMTQLKVLTHNLNILLANKSNNKVLFDIMNILGFDNFELRKCYLFKQHRFDNEGNPIFEYKTIVDDNGEEHIVEDRETMYELFFKSVNVNEEDIQSALENIVDTEKYERFIMGDSTWVDDSELRQKIYDTDFNYVDTKYMTVNIMYKMHKMLFEVAYVMRMILDKKIETSKIFLEMPKISSSPLSLLDCILSLITLTCRRHQMASNILKDPSQILSVMGFNFDADLEKIKADIKANSELDDELCVYLTRIQFKTPKDVNQMYTNIKDFEELLIDRMNETTDIHVYQLYDNLYRTLLMTGINENLFMMSNGKVADTYIEYLESINPKLAKYIDLLHEERIGEDIDYITTKIMEVLDSTQYMQYMNTLDSYMAEGILKLMRFFKSYTIDIRDLDIIYLMDSRYYNMIRVMGQFEKTMVELSGMDQTINIQYGDIMKYISSNINDKEVMKVITEFISESNNHINDSVNTNERLNLVNTNIDMYEKLSVLYTDLMIISQNIRTLDSINTDEYKKDIITVRNKSEVDSRHTLSNVDHTINANDLLLDDYCDFLNDSSGEIHNKSDYNVDEKSKFDTVIKTPNDHSIIEDDLSTTSTIVRLNDLLNTYDVVKLESYPTFKKILNKLNLKHFSSNVKKNKGVLDINDIHIILEPILLDIIDASNLELFKTKMYIFNAYITSIEELYHSNYISKNDKIVITKFIQIINKLIHLLKGLGTSIDRQLKTEEVRMITIYTDEYTSIYKLLGSCDKYINDFMYNILNSLIEIFEMLPQDIKVSQLLTIISSLFKDTKLCTPVSLKITLDEMSYTEQKLISIYSDLDKLIDTIGTETIIKISDFYIPIRTELSKLDKLQMTSNKFNTISTSTVTKLCNFIDANNFNIQDITRLISSRSVFKFILDDLIQKNTKIKDPINSLELHNLLDKYKSILNNSRELCDMNNIDTSSLEVFIDYSLIVTEQLELFMNESIQVDLQSNNIGQLLQLLQKCINSIVLGFNTFIDNSIDSMKFKDCIYPDVVRTKNINSILELTKSLKSNLCTPENIKVTSTINIIRD